MSSPTRPLDHLALHRAVDQLASRHPLLRKLAERNGPPPLWRRRPGFATLVRIILEQQVSLASADAVYRRLSAGVAPLTPWNVERAGRARLQRLGSTRQKASYIVDLAHAVTGGDVDLRELNRADDAGVRATLGPLRGFGPWTIDVYMINALGRADIWPEGDLALALSYRDERGWSEPPSQPELTRIARRWRPYRAVAARMLWHAYLERRRARAS